MPPSPNQIRPTSKAPAQKKARVDKAGASGAVGELQVAALVAAVDAVPEAAVAALTKAAPAPDKEPEVAAPEAAGTESPAALIDNNAAAPNGSAIDAEADGVADAESRLVVAVGTGGSAAVTGGSAAVAAGDSPPLLFSFALMLDLENSPGYVQKWAVAIKRYVDKTLPEFLNRHKEELQLESLVPTDVSMIQPLKIAPKTDIAALSSFREAMNYDNMIASFSRTSQYEAAGTIWMLDPIDEVVSGDNISAGQLECAMGQFSQSAFDISAVTAHMKRFSFDVPTPAFVDNSRVVQRVAPGETGVVLGRAVPMLAGRAVVLAWYAAVGEALGVSDATRVMKLYEAALSVPIRFRLCPDEDSRRMASLQFSETAFAVAGASGADVFWKFAEKVSGLSEVKAAIAVNMSNPKITAVLKKLGISFKGKVASETTAKALKSLAGFVSDDACRHAYALMEPFCPELREPTFLMRAAQLSATRGSAVENIQIARCNLVLLFDSLRVARLYCAGAAMLVGVELLHWRVHGLQLYVWLGGRILGKCSASYVGCVACTKLGCAVISPKTRSSMLPNFLGKRRKTLHLCTRSSRRGTSWTSCSTKLR